MKNFVRLHAATLLAFVFLIPSAPARAEIAETALSGPYLAGRTAQRVRDAQAASIYVEEALALDPTNPILIERLFQLQLSSGKFSEAVALANKIIVFNSQHRMARLVLGLEDMKAGRFDKARESFVEASYTPIGELTSAMLVAWTYAGEGSLNAAVREIDKLKTNDSFSNFRVFHEALLADFLKSDVRASGAYSKANAQAGQSLRIALATGNYLSRKTKKDEALKVYQAFLSNSGANVLVQAALTEAQTTTVPQPLIKSAMDGAAEALFSIASAMNDEESLDIALLYARLADAAGFDKSVINTLLGDVVLAAGNAEEAISTYRAVPPTSPLFANAEIQIALAQQQSENSSAAQAGLRTLLVREPGNYEAWMTLANILRNNESYKDADAAYATAEKLLPKLERHHWQLFYFRGICNERLKNWPIAEAQFRKSLELSPEEASVLNYLGYSLIDMKLKLEEAFGMVRKAVELRPNDGYIVDSLGWAHYQIAEFDKAVEQLERAVELKASDPIIAEHLGDAYWRSGRQLEAKFQWQHAKDNDPDAEDLKRIEKKLREGLTEPAPEKPKAAETKKSNNG
jgi:tetratricopeptide (TPR) repeat protein